MGNKNLRSMYGIFTKFEVKMVGYLRSSWSVKDLLYGFREHISCGTQRLVPSAQDSFILPAQVANQSAGFDSSCSLAE